jgi:hypothetical protein
MKPLRTLSTVRHGECRFVIGDAAGAATLFCGAETLPEKSWCAEHARIVYRPVDRAALERADEALAAWIDEQESPNIKENQT